MKWKGEKVLNILCPLMAFSFKYVLEDLKKNIMYFVKKIVSHQPMYVYMYVCINQSIYLSIYLHIYIIFSYLPI